MSVKIVLHLCLLSKIVLTLGQGQESSFFNGSSTDPERIQVESCCPPGQVLKLSKNPKRHGGLFEPEVLAKCVRKRGVRRLKDEERLLNVVDWVEDKNGNMTRTEMNVSLTGSRLPTCTMGLQVFYIGSRDSAPEEPCRTKSSVSSNQISQLCIFPFTFHDVVYNECTWAMAYLTNDKPWCSTKVDEAGKHVGDGGHWGNCEPECPVSPERPGDRLMTTPRTTTSNVYDYDHEYHYIPDDDEDYYYDDGLQILPTVSVLQHPECYEVKNNYRLYSDDGEWEEVPYITRNNCETMAKSDPRYVGWTYSDGWADHYCYLLTKIRSKGYDDDFVSGLAKDNCEHKRIRRSVQYDAETEDHGLGLLKLKLNTTKFCLADEWKGDVADAHWDTSNGNLVAVGLSCDPCERKVSCLMISKLYEELGRQKGGRGNPIFDKVADKNGDQEVSLDEFKDKMESYLKMLFTTQDTNKDGLVDKVGKPLLNLNLFLTVLNNTFEIFDKNEDDAITAKDFGMHELFGVGPIKFPAPLFILYSFIDPDRNEELTLQEATEFLTKSFSILDRDDDCSIDMDEIIATLVDSKLPDDYQLAVRLLGEYYFNLASFFFENLVDITDKNKDNKMSFEELLEFGDFSLLDPMINVAHEMSGPNLGTASFLIGGTRSQDRYEVSDLWLNTLQNFLEYFKHQTEPTKSKCY
eukprot:GFUD01012595.1.p1 GENE.GFUD01012595.1~~GFUD01012595.1.p1  ORF type:complete len:706 (+),score=172.82 GFUD01012595.1:51-2120(+)